jgi:DNA end-binding protein Ku
MARAMWKASLAVGALEVPVKLYSGVEDRGIHFRLLSAKERQPVEQRMVDPESEAEVASDEVRRGVEVEPGVFVVLDSEELERFAPEESRTIEVTRVVPRTAVDAAWYERPYFLGPDGSAGDYAALAKALEESGRIGIARWVMRGRRYAGALEVREGRLALLTFHAAAEVVSADELARPGSSAISAGERKMGEQLVAALEGEFEPDALVDDHRERVEKLIAAKKRGKRYAVKEPAAPRVAGDLGDALRRSLAAAKGGGRAAA